MANLQTHANFESIVNPDDLKLSQDYNNSRLQTAEDIATSRINDSTTGIEGIFDGLEGNRTLSPKSLSSAVRATVIGILGDTADDIQLSGNGSSAATLDTSFWRYQKDDVLSRIGDINDNTEASLSVVSIYKKSLAKTQSGVAEQLNNLRNKQSEFNENRSRWDKFGSGMGRVLTLGLRKNRAKAQEKSTSKLETEIEKQFKQLNDNVTKIEKEATTRKDRMQKHIKRVISSTHDVNEKSQLRKQLIDAVKHTGTIDTISLTNWKNLAGGTDITDNQEKIDFLEAARDLDFLQDDLSAMLTSEGKNLEQSEMITSAAVQQGIMTDINNFKFDDIKKMDPEFKDLDPAEKAPSTSALVEDIEGKLRGNGIDIEKTYKTGGDIGKSDLLTDSARLVLLIKAIANDIDNAKSAINKSVSTKQNILAWIKDIDEKNGGKIEKYTAAEAKNVQDELDVLQKAPEKIIEKMSTELGAVKLFDISDRSLDLKSFKTSFEGVSDNVMKKYQEFLNKKGKNNFPEADFNTIDAIWTKVKNSREFILSNIDQWISDKEKYDEEKKKLSTGKKSKLADFDNKIKELNDPSSGKIKKSFDAYNALAPTIVSSKSQQQDKAVRLKQIKDFIEKYKLEVKDLEKSKEDFIDSVELPEFSGLSGTNSVQKHLDEMSTEGAMNYSGKIKAKKDPSIGTPDERIQNFLTTENFKEEINKKFISNLAKNDQYELLKKCSEGTKVELTYKEVGGSQNIDFPSDLNNSENDKMFTVFRKDDKVIHLQNAAHDKIISISNPAASADGSKAYKNAVVRTSSGGTNNFFGGAGEHSLVYNMKIAA